MVRPRRNAVRVRERGIGLDTRAEIDHLQSLASPPPDGRGARSKHPLRPHPNGFGPERHEVQIWSVSKV